MGLVCVVCGDGVVVEFCLGGVVVGAVAAFYPFAAKIAAPDLCGVGMLISPLSMVPDSPSYVDLTPAQRQRAQDLPNL